MVRDIDLPWPGQGTWTCNMRRPSQKAAQDAIAAGYLGYGLLVASKEQFRSNEMNSFVSH
jgi:hypothetical protein